MLNALGQILKDTGLKLLEWKAAGIQNGRWEGSQFKAEADLLAHDFLTKSLKEKFSDIDILSEESYLEKQKIPQKYWLIDPIDGTASFASNYNGYVTQAALMVDQKPVLAAVYAPAFDQLFLAEKSKGARLISGTNPSGVELKITNSSEEIKIIDNYPKPQGIAQKLVQFFKTAQYIESGSIGLKVLRVADSTATIFIKDVSIRDWDIASPQLILEEAGGMLTDVNGKKIIYGKPEMRHFGLIATSTHNLHQKCVDWVQTQNQKKP